MAAEESDGLTEAEFYQELDRIHDAREEGRYVTSARAARDLARRAKASRLVLPYLQARFVTANGGSNTLYPASAAEAALDLIALIEDPSRRRQIQPDHDEGAVESWCDNWRVPCYHLLASNQGRLHGENSPGLHACIADGLEVARRTGSPFTSSFHEFACDVHLAADDLELAEHHAVANLTRPVGTNREDRRWVGSKDLCHITLLRGDIDEAMKAVRTSVALVSTWHARREGYYEVARHAQMVAVLGGLAAPDAESAYQAIAEFAPDRPESIYHPPSGEDLDHDLMEDRFSALLAAASGNFQAAIDTLVRWDTLLKPRALATWFGVRLRLIAVQKLAGRDAKARALASELESRASTAADYLTLRLLRRMMRGEVPTSPIPTLEPLTRGPWAPTTIEVNAASDQPAPSTAGPTTLPDGQPDSVGPEWEERIKGYWKQIGLALQNAAEADAAIARAAAESRPEGAAPEPQKPTLANCDAVVDDILSIDPASENVEVLDRLMQVLFITLERGKPRPDIWTYARRAMAAYPERPHLMASAASMADLLLKAEVPIPPPAPTAEQIKKLTTDAQTKAPDDARVFRRSAQVAISNGDLVEAERCLARASRLDRGNVWAADKLARIYSGSDRPSAALTVLDLCIRDCLPEDLDPAILWLAASLAQQLGQHQSAVTYFERFASMAPNEPGLEYHLAISLFETGRVNEAEQALDREWAREAAERPADAKEPLPIAALRAAIAGIRRDAEAITRWISIGLHEPLHQLEWLTPGTMQKCLMRLWKAALELREDDASRQRVQRVLSLSGLAPDDYWDVIRKRRPTESVKHFVVEIAQTLDDDWATCEFRLPGQEDWTSYRTRYGVLAPDEEFAEAAVRTVQSSGHDQPCEILLVEAEPGEYNDHPGITIRTWPQSPDEAADEAQEK